MFRHCFGTTMATLGSRHSPQMTRQRQYRPISLAMVKVDTLDSLLDAMGLVHTLDIGELLVDTLDIGELVLVDTLDIGELLLVDTLDSRQHPHRKLAHRLGIPQVAVAVAAVVAVVGHILASPVGMLAVQE
jgi:hypothetical protein